MFSIKQMQFLKELFNIGIKKQLKRMVAGRTGKLNTVNWTMQW